MDLILDIAIVNENERSMYCMLRKVYHDGFIPPYGIYFGDSAWGEKVKQPIRIIVNIEDNYCLCRFENISCKYEADCAKWEDIYKEHGWKGLREIPLSNK